MKRKKKWLSGIFVLVLIVCVSGCEQETVHFETESVVHEETEEGGTDSRQDAAADAESGADISTDAAVVSETVFVFVCGAVANEDVYELDAGSRIQDALSAAGGFLPEADTDAVNLADTVRDGQKIYFPYEGEIIENQEPGTASEQKVNLNTATKEELKELPGIGDAKADQIVAYRETNGPFRDIRDIKNVSGIGESIYTRIEAYITVE